MLEWINWRAPSVRAIDARAMTNLPGTQEALIVPLVLLISVSFALGIMMRAPRHFSLDNAAFYASIGSMGMPTLAMLPVSCGMPKNVYSTLGPRNADMLTLLAND